MNLFGIYRDEYNPALMLSIQYNVYHPLMAANEYSETRKNAYKYSKSLTTMRNPEMISIDKILNHREITSETKGEESVDEDEISVGCPSPVLSGIKLEEEDEDKSKDVRSPSCSSESSLPSGPNCQQSLDSFTYDVCKSERDKSEENHNSDAESTRRFSSSDEDVRDEPEEYFKPLKRLKMMKIDKTSYSISERSKSNLNKRLHRHNNHKVSNIISQTADENSDDGLTQTPGVKSFSICDILSHKPSKNAPSSSKIVRPWDCEPQEELAANPYLIPPPAHRGILPQPPLFLSQFHPQQIALHLRSVKSEDMSSAYESCSSSGRSSTGGSDCCTSPDVLNCSVQNPAVGGGQHQNHRSRNNEQTSRSKSGNGKSSNSSPLDALFNLTTKTFDELNGDSNGGE